MSALEEDRTPSPAAGAELAPIVPSPVIAALERALDASGDEAGRSAALASFGRAHARTPIVEAAESPTERIVTFVWRDGPGAPSEEVLLFVHGVTDERERDHDRDRDSETDLMSRLRGTDLWHLSYRMRSDWRASYCFYPRGPGASQPGPAGRRPSSGDPPDGGCWDGDAAGNGFVDDGLPDPTNPIRCRGRSGAERSVVEMPAAPPQPWLAYRDGLAARGTVTRYLGPGRRPVWLYDPPRSPRRARDAGIGPADRLAPSPAEHPVLGRPAAPPSRRLPVVVVFDGEAWAGPRDLAATLDNLIAEGLLRPCLVVMPEAGDPESRRAELGAGGSAGDWVVGELLPWVRSVAPASMNPDEVVVAGQGLGGYAALCCALGHPEAVGAVLSQSASLWQRELYAAAPDLVHRLHAYVEVGTREWVRREPNRSLAAALVGAGADVHYVEYNGGHDYACWRGGIADGIRALVGPPDPSAPE